MNEHPTDAAARECRKVLDQHLECPPAEALVSFREDELSAATATSVAAHLGRCPDCARLIEQLNEAESPMAEDAAYLAAREEDRHQVAGALGFRVGRPPAKPFLERLSWIWETRVPVMVPAAACALLLVAIFWPAQPVSPVTVLGKEVPIPSNDLQTRAAQQDFPIHSAPVDSVLKIRHVFMNSEIDVGTMINIEVIGRDGTIHLEPGSVVDISDTDIARPGVKSDLTISTPGSYLLRISNPRNTFPAVTLKLEIQAK